MFVSREAETLQLSCKQKTRGGLCLELLDVRRGQPELKRGQLEHRCFLELLFLSGALEQGAVASRRSLRDCTVAVKPALPRRVLMTR